MAEEKKIGERVAAFRDGLGINQRDFASQLGFSPGLIGQIESGRMEPSRNFLKRLADRWRVSADWVLYGTGSPTTAISAGFAARTDGARIEPVDLGRPGHGDFSTDGEDFSLIRRLDLSVSAGTGLVAVEGSVSERMAFSRTWLRRNGINADLSALVRVKGDSMAPTVPDGALVLVHAAEMTVVHEAIYAFIRKDQAFIKRIIPVNMDDQGRPTSVVIFSDNPAFAPDVVVGEAMNEIRIVGRVRTVMFSV